MTLWAREGNTVQASFRDLKIATERRLGRSIPLLTPEFYREYELHQALRIIGEDNARIFRSPLYEKDREAFDAFFLLAGTRGEVRYKKICLVGRDVSFSLHPIPESLYVRERERDLLPLLCSELLTKELPSSENDAGTASYQLVVSDLQSGYSWQRSVSPAEWQRWKMDLPKQVEQYRETVREDFSPLAYASQTLPVVDITRQPVRIQAAEAQQER